MSSVIVMTLTHWGWAGEEKVGHFELRAHVLRGGRESNDIPGCLLQESMDKNGEEEENNPCPPTAFGVNGDDCCAAG